VTRATTGRKQLAWRMLVWTVAVGLTLMLWASYVPVPVRGRLDAVSPFTQLLALRPLLGCGLVVAAAVAVPLARRRHHEAAASAVVLLAALLALGQMAPRALSDPSRGPSDLTVLTANTLRSSVKPPVIIALVRRTGADVVALPETNRTRAREYAAALSADRREPWLAFSDPKIGPDDGSARPTSMIARAALDPRATEQTAASIEGHGQVQVNLARLSAPATPHGLTVVAVHPSPPAPAGSQTGWRRDLLALRVLCRDGHLLAGDFNATIDHSPMRALKDAGCTDAASRTGQGLRATWAGGPFGIIRPSIDHVLTSGPWRPTASGVLPLAGSDHRAVWARIARTG
jgi:endonuclease/exonuclease/phosphatase (EEP) superfamily protein YafD